MLLLACVDAPERPLENPSAGGSAIDPRVEQRIREASAWEAAREGPPPGFPALPPLAAGRYTDPAFFALEREHVWRRAWLCVAREEDFAGPGSFRTTERAGFPLLLVRGAEGALRAFYNTCQHRGAPVVREACGTAKRLRCQYHAWTYDLDGRLVSVPDRRDFPRLDEAERGLVPLRCESWGGFVFVNADPAAPALADWLGPLAAELAPLRPAALRALAHRSERLPCNWKVATDAFLETYHVTTIHPATVARLLDPRGAVMGLFPNGHTRMVTPKRKEALAAQRARALAAQRARVLPGQPDLPGASALVRETNVAYGLFPNWITPLDSFGFPIITFWPVDVRTTDVEWTWYAPAGETEGSPFWQALLPAFDAVMVEDFRNLAPIQRSLESPGLRSIPLSYQERRIYWLHEQIDRMIGAERVPPALRIEPLLARYVEEAPA